MVAWVLVLIGIAMSSAEILKRLEPPSVRRIVGDGGRRFEMSRVDPGRVDCALVVSRVVFLSSMALGIRTSTGEMHAVCFTFAVM